MYVIIIFISTINAILKKKEKATGWEGGFTDKTVWTCLYACYLYNDFFVCLFVCFFIVFLKKNFFLDFTIALVNLMKIKIKIY